MEENRWANKVNGKMLNGLHLSGAFLGASQHPKALYKGKARLKQVKQWGLHLWEQPGRPVSAGWSCGQCSSRGAPVSPSAKPSPFTANEKEIPSLHLHFLPLVFVSLSPHWKKEGEMKRVIDRKRRIQCRALGGGEERGRKRRQDGKVNGG